MLLQISTYTIINYYHDGGLEMDLNFAFFLLNLTC